MKFNLTILFVLTNVFLVAQTDTLPSYFLKDGEIVLEFDIRKYEKGNEDNFSKVFKPAGNDLFPTLRAGKDWVKNGWYSKKLDHNVYQLCKDLDDFKEPFAWENKFLIDREYWAAPISEAAGSRDTVFNSTPFLPRSKVARVSEEGNAKFQLNGFGNARQVILSGSFNNWNEQEIKMKKTDTGWTINLDLPEGIYEYKFIADGKWMHDPKNPLQVVNQHRTLNSVLLIGKTITFHLPGYLDAKKVILSGSFNNWNEKAFQMSKGHDGWYIDVPLPPGKHYYKFIVDKKWMLDPENKLQQPDRHGHWNSVLLIH